METSIRLKNTTKHVRPSSEQKSEGEPQASNTQEDASSSTLEAQQETAKPIEPAVTAPVERVEIAEFETIFQRFQVPITNFIYHLLGNREQAYDLAQDVFVKAYKALLGGTVVQPGALSAWLYRIASNTTTDTLRRRRLISWLPLSLFNEDRGIGAGVVSDSGGSASDSFSSGDDQQEARGHSVTTMHERGGYDGGRFESRVADREIVERVLQQLPPKYAVCLWLYEHDGLSCAEIAEVLHISSSAVKMRLMRARERFIGLYHKEVGEED